VPEQDAYRELMKRRALREPVAYLSGRRGFWKLDFEVGSGVLIPRPETELLVELALARAGARGTPARVLDIGTGSGCIAISIAHELPEAMVVAVEKSPEAYAIARRNIEALVPGRVDLRAGDGVGPVAAETFDVVVSNPPYIPTQDIASLMKDVRDFEPALALDGGADGLDYVRRWSAAAAGLLNPGGAVLFEIGIGQKESALAAFRDADLIDLFAKDDLAGIPRVVGGRKAGST